MHVPSPSLAHRENVADQRTTPLAAMEQISRLPVHGTSAVAARVTAPRPPSAHPIAGGLTAPATIPHSPPRVGHVPALPVQGTLCRARRDCKPAEPRRVCRTPWSLACPDSAIPPFAGCHSNGPKLTARNDLGQPDRSPNNVRQGTSSRPTAIHSQ